MKAGPRWAPFDEARSLARVLKALSHPLRVQIVRLLQQGEVCLCDIEPLTRINQSNLSRHVSQLKEAGIVGERRLGRRVALHLLAAPILQALDAARQVAALEAKRRSRAATESAN